MPDLFMNLPHMMVKKFPCLTEVYKEEIYVFCIS